MNLALFPLIRLKKPMKTFYAPESILRAKLVEETHITQSPGKLRLQSRGFEPVMDLVF